MRLNFQKFFKRNKFYEYCTHRIMQGRAGIKPQTLGYKNSYLRSKYDEMWKL